MTNQTPPAFLVHAKDEGVSVRNSIVFSEALKKNGVPYNMHIYEKGGHGYGMYNKTSNVLWMNLVEDWLKKLDFIK